MQFDDSENQEYIVIFYDKRDQMAATVANYSRVETYQLKEKPDEPHIVPSERAVEFLSEKKIQFYDNNVWSKRKIVNKSVDSIKRRVVARLYPRMVCCCSIYMGKRS